MLEVQWTGKYPSLCFGEWIIKYNGQELNIPRDRKKRHMNTHGSYAHWTFDAGYSVGWTYYGDGLDQDEWIKENEDWILHMFHEKDINVSTMLLEELYDKIQDNDWRHGSCGGCI